MGKPTGFMEYTRELPVVRHPAERVADWDEFHGHADESQVDGAECLGRGGDAHRTSGRSWPLRPGQ